MSIEIDAAFAARILTSFIRDELAKFGFSRGILGLSGGLDSSVCASLAARALGPKNVVGLLMPYGPTFSRDVEDATALAARLKITTKQIDITPMVDPYFKVWGTESRVLRGNKMARERMSILYDYSAREKALILGTSNKTELLIGYGTIHGDMACGINPMGDLYKTQVRELARHLGVPASIIRKAPTAGLWSGQTDEQEIGLTYAELDEILENFVEKRKSGPELVKAGFKPGTVRRVAGMIKNSEFKRKLPPIAKLSPRSVGHDFLYPYDWDK